MKNKPETLVIFSPAFPKDEDDTEWLPWLQAIVKALNKNFPSLKIIVFAFQYPHHTKTYHWNGNTVIAFSGMHRGKFSHVFMWLNIIKKFYAVKRKQNIKGIFSLWCGECTLLAKYCSRFFSLPYYCWILGQDARPFNTYVKWIKPKPQQLIAMSDFLVQQFYDSHGIKPSGIIINGVEPSMFGPLPSKRDIDIIAVGGLSVLKRYDIFIEVIASLKEAFPTVNAMLCGDGEETDRFKIMITELALEKNIELTGAVKHKTAIQKMQQSKILLHPSSYEGFSSVCLEALYAGAHVISFIKPMKHDIKNWHIVHTKEEMISKAMELLNDKQLLHESVLVQSMDGIAKEIAALFGFTENNSK
ncbi:glycosyltransferase family 4 protein [Panacibacter ginsenosidivorans]|uniref:Glycosyltransferase family 4 protein n=1 Tax=Panacibacter ginsenosidivorans TaxID=1813871 RepID=A0A5B8V4P5_9BACT|nr:glycosyltransferase family 4 protein [Panacibacter ginsenosidivorans]QEC66172.1 glycosyltransferase family 4 protein [Panacibacter ginsenosidivorans]